MSDAPLTIDSFFGGRRGRSVGDEGALIDLDTQQVGMLALPSGVLGVVDPFASIDSPVRVQLAAGSYPVILTTGSYPEDFPGLVDPAYLSLVIAAGDPVSVELIPGSVIDGQLHGVTTWGGSIGFVDALAADGHIVAPDTPLFDTWLDAAANPQGILDVPLPWGEHGENVIGVPSPNDQGEYPLYITRGSDGAALAIHVDFLVVGEGRLQLDVKEWPL